LYARSGTWWVQPLADRPFTALRADSTFENTTHLGSEYAALLVEPDYRPQPRVDALPAPGGGVVAVAVDRAGGQRHEAGGSEVRQEERPARRRRGHRQDHPRELVEPMKQGGEA
jgi:hypothetical protein